MEHVLLLCQISKNINNIEENNLALLDFFTDFYINCDGLMYRKYIYTINYILHYSLINIFDHVVAIGFG